MKDDRLRQAYGELIRSRSSDARGVCVTPQAILELVEREGPESERLATLDHVMACTHCTRELELLRSVDRAGSGLSERRASRLLPTGRRQLAAAASVLLLVTVTLVWRSTGNRATFRSAAGTVTLVAPSGDMSVADPVRLVWNRVEDAVRYDVEVMDDSGRPIYAATSTDTTIVVPDSAELGTGIGLRWWVQATLSDSRTIRSAMLAFILH